MSLGGATGSNDFTSDAQAVEFADQIWNLLLGGSSSTRPFGDAVLDGIDLDIEGGSQDGHVAFVKRLRTHMDKGKKRYYVTAAPQCPFPDVYVGSIINSVAMDMVFVQFYNNACGLNNYQDANAWNYATWDDWAKNTSPNKNVRVYIGAPASQSSAGQGYVDAPVLGTIAQNVKKEFSSFGGVMLWDASSAYGNNRYDSAIKGFIKGSPSKPTTSKTKTKTQTSTKSTSPTPTLISATNAPTPTITKTPSPPKNCSGISAWDTQIPYESGDQVTYQGHVWTAQYWSFSAVPGDDSESWTDIGSC